MVSPFQSVLSRQAQSFYQQIADTTLFRAGLIINSEEPPAQVGSLTELVQQLILTVENQGVLITELQEQVSDLIAVDLPALEARLDVADEQLGNRIDAVISQLNVMDSHFTSVDNALDTRVSALEAWVSTTTNSQVTAAQLEAVDADLQNFKSSNQSKEAEQDGLLQGLRSDVETISAQQTSDKQLQTQRDYEQDLAAADTLILLNTLRANTQLFASYFRQGFIYVGNLYDGVRTLVASGAITSASASSNTLIYFTYGDAGYTPHIFCQLIDTDGPQSTSVLSLKINATNTDCTLAIRENIQQSQNVSIMVLMMRPLANMSVIIQ